MARRQDDKLDATPVRPPRRPGDSRRARRVTDRSPPSNGWLSSDQEEIERRRWRGRTEIVAISPIDTFHPYFGSFRVASGSGRDYEVEIRSLDQAINACGCADYRVNGLGTCKHIEGVLAALRRRGADAFAEASRAGSPRVEIYLPRTGEGVPRVDWPRKGGAVHPVRRALARHFTDDGRLSDASADGIEALIEAIAAIDPGSRAVIRVSRHLPLWVDEAKRRAARLEARATFLADVAAGQQSMDILRHKLLPYQREGMLHLAFGERVLLADDMGLGKTIQAIAACELLRRLRGIARVLVVCPASLKGEWEEQIARFSGADTLLVGGPRPQRLVQYARPAFFTVVNYEQVVIDAADINGIVKPDIIVLDEAQRIKNWHTKTAAAVKSLVSPYAFVLTGTPIENRIDEIYSIIQYLDPGLLGPLFRFNREFYELDHRGRPVDYKNLDELQRRLKPIMLRRRKHDVETELPGRTVTNYLVGMADEQRRRYEEYKYEAAKLASIAKRRPLTPQEFEKLQLVLACMRMLCDTPYILDPNCRISPKLEELERVLSDVTADPGRKIVIFSEWERMLSLVRELAQEMQLEFAWHTGSVPQQRRRAEINRFKLDPDCRLFLSTDSGSVGLNLQAASVVINLDLPWNPARLEQRIARAWRKNQRRTVDVINLVTEDSIEHNMLGLLSQKQALADGVLDGAGDLKSLRMPSGRGAMVERIAAVLASAPAAITPVTPSPDLLLRDELVARHGDGLLLLEAHRGLDGVDRFLVVLDSDQAVADERQRRATGTTADGAAIPSVEVIDRYAYESLNRLMKNGWVRIADDARRELLRAPGLMIDNGTNGQARLARGAELLGTAERKLRMALVLAEQGFAEEAAPVLTECLELAARARTVIVGGSSPNETSAEARDANSEGAAAPSAESPAPAPEAIAAVTGSMERALAALRGNLAALAKAA